MKGATWFSENSEFTLDYICVNDCALKCIESAYILEGVRKKWQWKKWQWNK